jgi:hypothetical protein
MRICPEPLTDHESVLEFENIATYEPVSVARLRLHETVVFIGAFVIESSTIPTVSQNV